jgi:hypothetical protein
MRWLANILEECVQQEIKFISPVGAHPRVPAERRIAFGRAPFAHSLRKCGGFCAFATSADRVRPPSSGAYFRRLRATYLHYLSSDSRAGDPAAHSRRGCSS